MLDSLRGFAKSWPGKIMGGFLLVGIAGFGINNVITGLGSSTVARVGNEEIDSRTFLRAYQSQMNQVAQQLGSVPTPEQALNLGIPSMVLQDLGQNAALDQMANGFGLGVSEQKLSEMLREDPSFQGTLGTFDPNNFRQVLAQSGITEAEYFEDQSNAARRQQLVLSLFGDTKLPDTAASLINRYVADQRTIDYFVLGDTNIETPPAPNEEQLAAYLTEHQAEFRTVETRSVTMLRLSPADLAATKTIDDAAIAAEYERTKASLTKSEQRTIEQVVLSTPEQIATFEAGLAANTPFATLVADNGLTPTSLGTLAQSAITDATLASTAFGLPADGFAIVDGVAGKRAVHVTAIEAGGQTSLEDARDTIAQNLALAEARKEIADVLDQVEELRAAFKPLTEIAGRFNLDLYQTDVTASGSELAVIPDLAPEDSTRVAQAIFKATPDQLTPAIQLAGNGNLWFELGEVSPASDQTLDEVRDAVAAAYTAEVTDDAITAATTEAVKRLDNGEALADVAASYNVFPQLSAPFTRFGNADGSVDSAVATVVFNGPPESQGTAVSQTGDHVVYSVVDVTPAEGPLEAQAGDQLETEARVGLYGDFAAAVRDEAGLRINQQALQQTLALNTGL